MELMIYTFTIERVTMILLTILKTVFMAIVIMLVILDILGDWDNSENKSQKQSTEAPNPQPLGFYQKVAKWSVTLDGVSVSWWSDKQETAKAWRQVRTEWFNQGKTYEEWLGLYRHNKSQQSLAHKEFYRKMAEMPL